jgi:hypothetical protein
VAVRAKLVNLGMLLGSTVITLLACEGATALWAKTHPVLGETPARLLRRHPAPYARSPYYSKPFVEEQEFRGGSFFAPPGTELILVRDAQGVFINNAGGFRVTTDAPMGAPRRILVFGGSTVYSGEVPDPFTIPSYLQRLLNEAAPGQFQVVNAGVSSVNVAQQLARLRTIPLRADDTVVFYDGINDLVQGVYYQSARGTIAGTEQDHYARLSLVQRGIFKLTRLPLVRHSYLLDYVLVPSAYREVPAHVREGGARARLLAQVAEVYAEKHREAHGLAGAAGARFLHFLQPNLFSAPLRTRYEEQLAANPRVVYGGYREVFTFGQEHLRRAGEAPAAQGIPSADPSGVLRVLPSSEDVYLDAMHVTEVANRLVARALFRELMPGRLAAAAALDESEVEAFHREDRATWDHFHAGRAATGARAGEVNLIENGDFARGLEAWRQAQREDLDGRYPRVTLHNYLNQEIRPLAEDMEVAVTARCAGDDVVRVNLFWADATGFGDIAADRFSFDCGIDVKRSAFSVRRPPGAQRAGLVIDAPDDAHPIVVHRVEVHPLAPASGKE